MQKKEKKNSCARTRRPKSWPVPPSVSPFNLFIWHASTYARKQIHSHWKTSAEEEEGQVTYLLLLWRQPCIYFYSFHMHSPSSPFILSSLCREETHQLMFSFTVIGWFKAASVNCAPLPISPLLFIYTLPSSSSSTPFLVYFGSLCFFPSKHVMSCASVSAGWYCEAISCDCSPSWWISLEGHLKKKKEKKVPQGQNHLPTHL